MFVLRISAQIGKFGKVDLLFGKEDVWFGKKDFSSFWKRLQWFENLSEIHTLFGEQVDY